MSNKNIYLCILFLESYFTKFICLNFLLKKQKKFNFLYIKHVYSCFDFKKSKYCKKERENELKS